MAQLVRVSQAVRALDAACAAWEATDLDPRQAIAVCRQRLQDARVALDIPLIAAYEPRGWLGGTRNSVSALLRGVRVALGREASGINEPHLALRDAIAVLGALYLAVLDKYIRLDHTEEAEHD